MNKIFRLLYNDTFSEFVLLQTGVRALQYTARLAAVLISFF